MTTAFERIRDALQAHGSKLANVKDHEFMAQCPAHDDGRPSLHVTDSRHGRDGQALVHCFAGCENAEIVDALQMTLKDLFDTPGHVDYHYDSGRTVRRLWDKSKFSQRGDRSMCELYRRSEVEEAVKRGEAIYLVEGEKDANTVATVWGKPATSAPMGARNFGRVDVTPLRGANVIAVVDRDEEGRKWAGHVHDKLTEVAASLTLVQAAKGKDATDHILAGKTSEEFEPFELEPQGRRLVLTPLSKIEAKPVRWAWRDDHGGRIPAGELTVIAGRGGTGKSSFAIWLGSQITRGTLPGAMQGTPKNVLWVTAEESYGHAVRPRFEIAGADLDRVFSVTASEGESSELRLILPHDTRQLETMITGNDIGLVVLTGDVS